MAQRGRPKKLKEGIPPEPTEVILTSEPKPQVENQLKCAHDAFHDSTPLIEANGVWKNEKWYCSEACARYH